MDVITKDDFVQNLSKYYKLIKDGKLFIHPTDTIYGIGCDATNSKAVMHARDAKNRHTKAFSVIAPSKDWIRENCTVTKDGEKWLEKLPGPYTLIFHLKKKYAVAPEVNPAQDTLAVRIPSHWFSKAAQELNIPIVTTAANKVGQIFMTTLDDLDPDIAKHIDFTIYEGEKKAKHSIVIDITQGGKIVY